MPKKIVASEIAAQVGTFYPAPFDEPCLTRERQRLGDAAGLNQFGVNLLRLPAGAWSSQMHWHTHEDEFVYVLEGEVVLVSTDGEIVLKAGDAAGFKAGDETGHCLQNRTTKEVKVLEVGSRNKHDKAYYPGLDLVADPHSGTAMFTKVDGSPYPNEGRKSRKA